LRRLSELIDPLTLGERSHVRSPSGQILGAAEFMAHPGRPLSIRERQEAIREKVRATTAKLAEEAKKAEEEAAAAAAAKKRKHKVSMMAEFWADKDRKPGDSPAHITCEFCGMDFKSFGGRKKHREQFHPADQSIYCPGKDDGCHLLFTRAAHMIAHLEEGECAVIGAYEFRASIVHKHIIKQIMENPEEFAHNLQANKAFADRRRGLGVIVDSTESHKQGERKNGNILDEESEEQISGYKPLQPETELMQAPSPSSRAKQETWPRLPRSALSQMNDSMKSMSIGSQAASSSGVETCTSFASPTSSATVDGREVKETKANPKGTLAAWSTGKTSQALFKDAKPTLPSRELAKKHEEELASPQNNLMYSHFYDPESPEYDPDFFLSPYTERYECPFPGCGFEGGSSFDTPSELQDHLSWAHLRTNFSCTTCFKRFVSATALVAHIESTQRCRVKDSSNYHVLLDSISGGFLEATKVRQPSIINPERSVIRAGQQPANGVMTMKYSSKMPKRN
ncbi:hypothetical protein KC352_g26994, partial [Hortaea werneckii]